MTEIAINDIIKCGVGLIAIAIAFINIGMHLKAQKANFEEVEKIKKDILNHKNSVKRMLYREDGSQIFTRAEKTDTLELQFHEFQTEHRQFQQHVLTTLAEIITKLDVVISDKAYYQSKKDNHYDN